MKDIIHIEDCKLTMQRMPDNAVDYVFTSPPDMDELGMDPGKASGRIQYKEFIEGVWAGCARVAPVVTLAIQDRKHNSTIIPKHADFLQYFVRDLQWNMVGYKLWVNTEKINLYRLNFRHLMTFAAGKPKQNWPKEYMYDAFQDIVVQKPGFKYSMAVATVMRCIANFTQLGGVVYDPFMGSGTTAVAALKLGRHYVGSEIDLDVAKMAANRVEKYLCKASSS